MVNLARLRSIYFPAPCMGWILGPTHGSATNHELMDESALALFLSFIFAFYIPLFPGLSFFFSLAVGIEYDGMAIPGRVSRACEMAHDE